MPSDAVLLAISLTGLSVIVGAILFFAGFFQSKKVADAPENEEEVLKAGGRRTAGGLAALRKRKEKKNKREDANNANNANNANDVNDANTNAAVEPGAVVAAEPDEDAAAVDQDGNEIVEPRAMTKKELQKELKRREREELRQFDEQRREEQRKRQEAKDEAYLKKREDEARLELEREEAERQLAEAKAKKEQDEFDQWKNMFTVEAEGSKADAESEESQMLLQQFVDYIKSRKVVLLEDLGAAFGLPTQDAIQRVEALQQANRITGLIDDRGKFIYITEEEMDKVAKFIQRKGRLGLGELSKECNKLIRLDGEKETSGIAAVDWLAAAEAEQPEQPATA